MNPKIAFENRTARLVREANTPTYSTSTDVDARAKQREARLDWAEDFTGPDFCHVCGRCTDHAGEHSDEQLMAFYNSSRGHFLRGN